MNSPDYAVQITAHEQAELVAVERDDKPLGQDEVTGRTLASLISAGTELANNYQGSVFPVNPGYSAVFEVEEIGSAVAGIKPGDLMMSTGPHRSFQRARAQSCLLVPSGLSPEQAVFARFIGVSMTTLTTTSARPPQKVLVMGLGLIGHLAAKVFAACGYDVTGCDPSEYRRGLMAQTGIPVTESIDLSSSELIGKVALVLECSGHEAAVLDGCKVVRKHGEVVTIGTPWRQRTEITAHELLKLVFRNYVILRSGWEWVLPANETDFIVGSLMGNLAAALQWLADGRISVAGIYRKVSPTKAQEAYQDLLHAPRSPVLATVFDWSACV